MVWAGDRAPDVALQATTGRTLSLSELLLTRKSVLLVFLRHLG